MSRRLGDAVLLYCGDAATFTDLQATLQALGSAKFVGTDAGRASVMDAALIAFFYGTIAGFIHGAALATTEGVAIGELLQLYGPFFSGFIANAVAETGHRISARYYGNPQSFMDTHLGGIDLLVLGSSRDAAVDARVPQAIRGHIRQRHRGRTRRRRHRIPGRGDKHPRHPRTRLRTHNRRAPPSLGAPMPGVPGTAGSIIR